MNKFIWQLLLTGCLGFIFTPFEIYAQPGPGYGGWGPGLMGWGMMGWFGPMMMLFFLAGIVIAAFFLIRWLMAFSKGGFYPRAEDSALEILKKRYARGEIKKEEFEEKKKDLQD